MRFSYTRRWVLAALLSAGLATAATFTVRADDKKDGDEVKIKFEEAPSAVQKTITREAEGDKVTTVDKETKKGKTIYEADAKIDKHNYEIKVAEDGTLLSKKLDEEDDKD